MSWFVVDDQAFQHPKHTMLVRRGLAGEADALAAGYLWVLMGSRLKAALKDGVLDRFDLFGVVPDPRVLRWAQILVEVGLWHDSDHCCERCEPPPRGSWCFHDWRRYYKRTGAQERLERAMQDERKDPALKTAVWERDRLPGTDPDGPDEALCVYCRRRVSRTTRGGDLAPEIDHVWARPMGVDGLAVSCRHCNRQKGRRSAEEAGLTFHPTAAHAAALARRRETFSHPQGSAEMLHGAGPAADTAPSGGTVDDEARSHPQGSAGRAGHGSHPQGSADLPSDVVDASPPAAAGAPPSSGPQEPPGRPEPAPRCPGRSLPFSGPQEGSRRPQPDAAAVSADRGAPAPPTAGADAPPAASRAHGPTRAPALPAARALAGQGPAGAGTAGQEQGGARRGRRRRRAKKKPRTCPIHDDRLPCRLCQEGLP